jgi:toxin ParE1/3/4
VTDYRLSAAAEAELVDILIRSRQQFGELAQQRYQALMFTAFTDIAANPTGPNVSWKTLNRGRAGIYHISHSRGHVPDPPGPVGEPRHSVVFIEADDGVVLIVGFIHDRMLMPRALKRLLQRSSD